MSDPIVRGKKEREMTDKESQNNTQTVPPGGSLADGTPPEGPEPTQEKVDLEEQPKVQGRSRQGGQAKMISPPRKSINTPQRLARGPKRLPGESAQAYRAFRVYLNLGPGRSLDKAWQFLRAPLGDNASARRPGQWARWCAKHDWVERAGAYDEFTEEKKRSADAERRRNQPESNADQKLVDGGGHAGDKRESHRQDNHDRAGSKGRPSKLTDRLREDFCNFAAMSGSMETALAITGIGRETYYRWKRRVRDGRGSPLQKSPLAVLAGNVPACISAGDVDGDGVREKRDLLDYSSAGITRPGASTNGRTPCAPPSPGDASSPTKENS